MKRRHFINLLYCVPAICSTASAQPPGRQRRRIGALVLLDNDAQGRSRFAAFEDGLKELGWSEENLRIDIRWAGNDSRKAETYAAELAQTRPDAILAHGTEGVGSLSKLTSTIPLVFVQVTDPVKAGFVKSLSSPGGNVTGFANFGGAVGGERLRLLKGLAPRVRRVLVLYEADYPALPGLFAATRREANAIGVQLTEDGVRDAVQLERDISNYAGVYGRVCRVSCRSTRRSGGCLDPRRAVSAAFSGRPSTAEDNSARLLSNG